MNTSLLLDHEPVADGGFFVRLALVIEGEDVAAYGSGVPGSRREGGPLAGAAYPVEARNVQIAVRPGRDAEFIQMTHTFDSVGSGRVLTILVGDVHCVDRIRIRMDALVGPGRRVGDEADVGRLVVLAHTEGRDGSLQLRTVNLPIRISPRHGGNVRPHVGTTRISEKLSSEWASRARRALRDDEIPPQCA